MHDLDQTQLEWESTPFASGRPLLSEREELELAAEFLEITSEAELEQFLGNLRKKIGDQIKPGAPYAPVADAIMIGAPLAVGAALPHHPHLALAAQGATTLGLKTIYNALTKEELEMLSQELETLSLEDRELEIARRYVRFAGTGLANAAEGRTDDPEEAAANALTEAAYAHAPWLVPLIEDIFAPSNNDDDASDTNGHWYRQGSAIVLDLD